MLNIVMLSVTWLSVIMLNAVVLSVILPIASKIEVEEHSSLLYSKVDEKEKVLLQ